MVTIKYRLVGSVSNPVFQKTFETHAAALDWAKAQGNVLIVEVESVGAATLSRIFG